MCMIGNCIRGVCSLLHDVGPLWERARDVARGTRNLLGMWGLGTGIQLGRAGTGGGRIEISGNVEQSKEIGGLCGDRWATRVIAPAIIRRWPWAWVGPPVLGGRDHPSVSGPVRNSCCAPLDMNEMQEMEMGVDCAEEYGMGVVEFAELPSFLSLMAHIAVDFL